MVQHYTSAGSLVSISTNYGKLEMKECDKYISALGELYSIRTSKFRANRPMELLVSNLHTDSVNRTETRQTTDWLLSNMIFPLSAVINSKKY